MPKFSFAAIEPTLHQAIDDQLEDSSLESMERRISDFLDFEQIYSTEFVETPNFKPKPIVSHRISFDRTHTVNIASSATPLQTRGASSANPGPSMVNKKVGASILARRTKKPLSLVFA